MNFIVSIKFFLWASYETKCLIAIYVWIKLHKCRSTITPFDNFRQNVIFIYPSVKLRSHHYFDHCVSNFIKLKQQ